MRLICGIHVTTALFLIPCAASGSDSPAATLACGAGQADLAEPAGGLDWNNLSASEVETLAEQWRAQQRAQSGWTTRIAAYYSIRGKDRAKLYLMNGFADSIDVTVAASGRRAGEYPLGTFKLRPRSHVEIDLTEALADAGPHFATGSLRATFVGDSSMVLGWVMQRRNGATANIPLQAVAAVSDADSGAIYSFWNMDLLSSGSGQPRFYVANSGQAPMEYTATFAASGEPLGSIPTTLAPFSVEQLTPPAGTVARTGYVEIRPVGGDELPVVVGLLEDEDQLVRLPTFQISDTALDVEYVSMEARLKSGGSKFGGSTDKGLALGLFNPSERAQTLDVSVIESATGVTVAEVSVPMDAAEIVSLDLMKEIVARTSGSLPEVVFMRISGEAPFVPPLATVTTSYGAVAPIEFHKLSAAHPFGRFAIPRLDENAVWTSILNLGDEPAQVAGQLFWEGGAYAIDPLSIEPGTSQTFHFREIVAKATPDAIGRVPSGPLPGAYFHWVLVSGPPALLGRTYVQPNDSPVPDIVMCEGCCFEIPWATILPFGNNNTVEFLPGQTPNAKAAYKYTT